MPVKTLTPPIQTPIVDPKTGLVTVPWALFFETLARQVKDINAVVFP